MFPFTRKPNFKNLGELDYNLYWMHRGENSVSLRKNLRSRETMFTQWIVRKSSVLDIGCGDSPLPGYLKEKNDCAVEVFDISESMIELQKSHAHISGSVVDISSDSFVVDKQYDYIILSEVLEHLVYPEKVLLKLKGKSKFLILSIPNSAYYKYRFWLLFHGRFFTQWVYHPAEHLRFWSHTDFSDWLGALGFDIKKSWASNGLSFGPIHLENLNKNLLGHQICYLVTRRDSTESEK